MHPQDLHPHPMLIETILLQHGRYCRLYWHQMRIRMSLARLGTQPRWHLHELLPDPAQQLDPARVRLQYSPRGIESLNILPHEPRQWHRLDLAEIPRAYQYGLKYADRSGLQQLLCAQPLADDILLMHQGSLLDTSCANIALQIQGHWLTPARPLLPGTTRAHLIATGLIEPADLRVDDLAAATQIALFNALRGWQQFGYREMYAGTQRTKPAALLLEPTGTKGIGELSR